MRAFPIEQLLLCEHYPFDIDMLFFFLPLMEGPRSLPPRIVGPPLLVKGSLPLSLRLRDSALFLLRCKTES